METCVREAENDIKTVPVADIGDVAITKTVTLTYVPYTGNEQRIVIERPAVNEFMVNKPA